MLASITKGITFISPNRNKMKSIAKHQIEKAQELGTIAASKNANRIPGNDEQLMVLVAFREIGKTPKGEANTIKIFHAWLDAFDFAKRQLAMTGVIM